MLKNKHCGHLTITDEFGNSSYLLKMEEIVTTSFKRRHLPHWHVQNKPYFVTFRLKNTIPQNVVDELKQKREKLISSGASDQIIDEFNKHEFYTIESILDKINNKICFLKNPEIANLISNSFDYLKEKMFWDYLCYTIMPNHVHCLMINIKHENISLESALGALKQHVAYEGNKILKRNGKMWCDENFDHWCRTQESVDKFIQYIKNNPVKAGLVNNWQEWKWTKLK